MMSLLVLTLAACACAQQLSGLGLENPLPTSTQYYNPLTADFDDFARQVLADTVTPGIAIAVVHGNETWSKGYGYADIENGVPVTPRTLFAAGSTTKSFVAATMSKLVDSNESAYKDVNWTTKLVDLIREDFVLQDPYTTQRISLIDAMSHRTGMPRHDLSWVNKPHVTLREQVRQMRYLPLHRELREGYEYCNLMFTAVAHAIEVLTGTELGKLFRQWMFEPLGMQETFYDLDEALAYADQSQGEVAMARAYLYDNATLHANVRVPWTDLPPPTGAGGVVSNVLDYTNWVRAFLHPSNASNPISASAIAMMSSPHIATPDSPISPFTPSTGFYGLGLISGVYRGTRITGHDGGIAGYMTKMMWLPEHDAGVVVFQNAYSLAAETLAWRLIDEILGTPPDERHDGVRVAEEIKAAKIRELDGALERLYPDAGKVAHVAPALPLPDYEGTYSHPAYHDFTVSMASEASADALPGAPLPLRVSQSPGAYLNVSATLHHVSGEHWLARLKMGTERLWLTEDAVKAKFEVGVSGKVEGLFLQAESALEEMAWFERAKD